MFASFDLVYHYISMSDNESIVVCIKAGKAARMSTMAAASIVKVRATFTFAKPGSNPATYIQDPIDISKHIGEIYASDYNELKERIAILAQGPDSNLYFHHDKSHVYPFNDSQYHSGAIYGRKQPRIDDEDRNSKVTSCYSSQNI